MPRILIEGGEDCVGPIHVRLVAGSEHEDGIIGMRSRLAAVPTREYRVSQTDYTIVSPPDTLIVCPVM